MQAVSDENNKARQLKIIFAPIEFLIAGWGGFVVHIVPERADNHQVGAVPVVPVQTRWWCE